MCYVIIQKKPKKCIHIKKSCQEAIALIQSLTKAEGSDVFTIESVCKSLKDGQEYTCPKYTVRLQ